jgi:(p)ppGpp synthase/HD superfamily hydrolase
MNVTTRLEKAIRVATIAHRNQKRKGSDTPYITHPYSVMCLASEDTKDEDILIACLFHDIIEDVPDEYPRGKMLDEFGERVVSIVDGVTKDSTLKDWQDRSNAYLDHLEHKASDESVLVSCADKVHNLMTILEDYRTLGDELWSRFNAGKKQQLWWYESVLRVTSKRMPSLSLNKRLTELVKEFQDLA